MPLEQVIRDRDERELLRDRAIVVKRLKPLPLEAVVRGYLIGSGWKDYQRDGAVCGIALPAGLRLADRLPEPHLHAGDQGAQGQHDENISFEHIAELVGRELAAQVRDRRCRSTSTPPSTRVARGIIIADTKFEFGLDEGGRLVLIDEVLTPDSSRFWPADTWRTGLQSAELRQAVRARLPGNARLEQEGAGPEAAAAHHRPHE